MQCMDYHFVVATVSLAWGENRPRPYPRDTERSVPEPAPGGELLCLAATLRLALM